MVGWLSARARRKFLRARARAQQTILTTPHTTTDRTTAGVTLGVPGTAYEPNSGSAEVS